LRVLYQLAAAIAAQSIVLVLTQQQKADR